MYQQVCQNLFSSTLHINVSNLHVADSRMKYQHEREKRRITDL